MNRKFLASVILSAGLVFSGAAHSQSGIAHSGEAAYSSEQFVEFMIKSANMGVARGICVGTVDECNSKPAKSVGFDMRVSFELNSSELTDEAISNLEQIAIALGDERLSAAKFIVEGHTDATGSDKYNMTLSQRRAQSVTAFLLDKGLSSEKISAVGVGESSPRTADAFDPSNRRVEIRINLQ